ncbi:MAG: protease complex subunit PrcB family protein [Bacillota bacterium]|nr:protease complex subunit PrcB family protein [Bacillota bacterium]
MKLVGIFFLVSLVLILAISCSVRAPVPDIVPEPNQNSEEEPDIQEPDKEIVLQEGESITFNRPDYSQLPENIKNWLENSSRTFLGHQKEFEGKTYILVTFGEKKTGGYGVDIKDIVFENNSLTAIVELQEPSPSDNVIQAFTYPYDLVSVDFTGFPVVFSAYGDMEYIFELKGVEELKPIVAESEWIKIFGPPPGSVNHAGFTVEGVANVYEGTVSYRLISRGVILLEGFTTAAQGSWMYFSFDIDLSSVEADAKSEDFKLELFSESAKDGSDMFKVVIPLKLK